MCRTGRMSASLRFRFLRKFPDVVDVAGLDLLVRSSPEIKHDDRTGRPLLVDVDGFPDDVGNMDASQQARQDSVSKSGPDQRKHRKRVLRLKRDARCKSGTRPHVHYEGVQSHFLLARKYD